MRDRRLKRLIATTATLAVLALLATWFVPWVWKDGLMRMTFSFAACAFTFQATWGVCILDERLRRRQEKEANDERP